MSYSRMCMWGEGFVDLLKPYNPSQRFVVTGNHILTLRQPEVELNGRAISFFLQKDSRLITDDAWQSMLELVVWAAQRFSDWEIRVREHPSAPLSVQELAMFSGLGNLRLMPSKDWSLDEVLLGCRIAVAVYSTTILEASATGAIALIINVTGMPRYIPDLAAEGAAIEVHDFEAAREALFGLSQSDDWSKSIRQRFGAMTKRFFACGAPEAMAAITTEIRSLCRGQAP